MFDNALQAWFGTMTNFDLALMHVLFRAAAEGAEVLERDTEDDGNLSGTGKSRFTYRPFTLEGNFAFTAAMQEMLLQSHTGVIQVFPPCRRIGKTCRSRSCGRRVPSSSPLRCRRDASSACA